MSTLPDIPAGKLAALLNPEREAMLTLTARLALAGPVHVLDMGNCFDVYHVARHIRRHTPHLTPALESIILARAFTCYQVKALVEQTPPETAPSLVFNLLSTFCDESVSAAESYRLLHLVMGHLQHLSRNAPVIISLRHPRQPERAGLVQVVLKATDQVFIWDTPPAPVPLKLL